MRRRPGHLERQRERIRQLIAAEPSRSSRSIAKALGCSTHTVIRQRELHVLEHADDGTGVGVQPNGTARAPHPGSENLIAPAGPDNLRALKHGVDSEVKLAPLRMQGEDWARRRWAWIDDARCLLVADLMARVELARRWLEQQGTVVRNRRGEVFPVADRLERWSARLDTLIRSLDTEAERRLDALPLEQLLELEEAQ